MSTRKATWVNADGLEVGFGSQVRNNNDAAGLHVDGNTKVIEMIVEAGNLQPVGTAVTNKNFFVPAGAHIVEVKLFNETVWSHAIEVGAMKIGGTDIDQNGFIASGAHAANAVITGAGALVGTRAAENLYIAVTPTATAPTTGKGKLVVRYEV